MKAKAVVLLLAALPLLVACSGKASTSAVQDVYQGPGRVAGDHQQELMRACAEAVLELALDGAVPEDADPQALYHMCLLQNGAFI